MDKQIKISVVRAAREAGKILMGNFGTRYKIQAKTPRDLVSDIDLQSEQAIISILKKRYPDYNILAEEAGREKKQSEFTWIIDPLDGTTNYTIGNPFFNVSIALAKGNEIIAGCVHAPFTKELFYAEKGRGALLNDKPVTVSDKDDIKESLVAFCHGTNDTEVKRVTEIYRILKPAARDFTQMRSGALELAFVAAGRIEAYISNGSRTWDAAA